MDLDGGRQLEAEGDWVNSMSEAEGSDQLWELLASVALCPRRCCWGTLANRLHVLILIQQ